MEQQKQPTYQLLKLILLAALVVYLLATGHSVQDIATLISAFVP